MVKFRMAVLAAIMVPIVSLGTQPALADTIFDAMAKAYENNPDLNSVRAGLRATDEGVPIAKAGMRPQISAFASNTGSKLDIDKTHPITTTTNPFTGEVTIQRNTIDEQRLKFGQQQYGITITQQIFDGFQTLNNVRAAESNVFANRAALKGQEIQILLAAAESYANISRDQQIVGIRKQNIAFLNEQLKAANTRLDVGEGTRTDVSIAEAELAQSRAILASAVFQLKRSEAVYVQIVGEPPRGIKQPKPLSKLMPKNIDKAVEIGLHEHPSILSVEYQIDTVGFQVKAAEGALLPGVVVQGQLTRNEGNSPVSGLNDYSSASVTARLNVPIYQGGAEYAQVRQAKERLGQQRILLDSARLEVQQTIVTAIAQFEAAQAVISANAAQLTASNAALSGVIEERNVGQATTLDVLNAQETVLNAKESIAQSQRDAVVASFSVLASMGRLTVDTVNLKVDVYDPKEHYKKTKDKWIGLRTVDGR